MNLQDHISRMADNHGIPSQLAFAMAKTLTGLDMTRFDFHSTHRWLWDVQKNKPFRNLTDDEALSCVAPADFPGSLFSFETADTEFIGQKCAWGPFALKGSEARQAGLVDDFMLLCTDPQTTTHYFLKFMQTLRDKYFEKHGWGGVACAYFAGRPRRNDEGEFLEDAFLRLLSKHGAKGLINYS